MAFQQTGTEFADVLTGLGIDDPDSYFDDLIYGLAGDDIITLLARPGWVWGGLGEDYLIGGSSGDWLIGEAGHDRIFGYGGSDLLDGGTGADIIHGGWGLDTIFGGAGDDTIYGLGYDPVGSAVEGDNDILTGGDGDDTIYGQAGDDLVYGDAGNDVLSGGAGSDWIFGFEDNDSINGGAGNDVLFGGDGIDFIFDVEGDNLIASGRGADTVITGAGNDTIYSGGYNDFDPPRPVIRVGDVVVDEGEPPRSTALFEAETAEQWDFTSPTAGFPGASDSRSWVSSYGKVVFVGFDPDTPIQMPSGPGDHISSGAGNDIIFAGEFNDTILDGLGNDSVSSGGGADLLYLDGGIDVITLLSTVARDFIAFLGFRGTYNIVQGLVSNPETLIYDRASAVGAGNTDYIYGFSAADGDTIRYANTLGNDVQFADNGAGGVWLYNSDGIFASIDSASIADVQGAFAYF